MKLILTAALVAVSIVSFSGGVVVGAYLTAEGAGDFVVYRRVVGDGFMCYGYDPETGVTTGMFYAGEDRRCHLKDLLRVRLYLGAKSTLPPWAMHFVPKPAVAGNL